jgi:hypothetical protein
MDVQVQIKGIGYKRGTSGWLADGLRSGKITIYESISKSGKHALYIKDGDQAAVCLAIWDIMDFARYADAEVAQYIDYAPNDNWAEVDALLALTEAASDALQALAQGWCNQVKSERAADPDISLSIKRVECLT